MRLFIAFSLPDGVKNNLYFQSEALKPFATKGRFVPKDNFHVTLQFLGDTDPSKLPWIYQVMDNVKQFDAPTMSVAQVVAWKSAKVVCAKYKAKGVEPLQTALANGLERLGFVAERRAYRPHTTLCRDYAFDLPFADVVKNVPLYNKPFVCDTVTLYESIFEKSGMRYNPLYEIKLNTNQ